MAIGPTKPDFDLPVLTGAVTYYTHILDEVSRLGIPVSFDGQGADEGIALEILAAGELYRTDVEKDTLSSDEAVGQRFIFHSASVHATSGDKDRWGFTSFDVVSPDTGQRLILNSSSVTMLARFAAAVKTGKVPLDAEVWRSEVPTKRGNYPIDLVAPGSKAKPAKANGKSKPAGGATQAEADGNGEDF